MDNLEQVDKRLNAAFDELQTLVDRYRQSAFKNETPFDKHMMPARIKLRLKLIADIGNDRSEVWRRVYRTREEVQREEHP